MASSVLRTVIVDSDPQVRASIRHTLATAPSLAIVGEYDDLNEAALKAPGGRPDLMIVEVPVDTARGEAWSAAAVERLARRLPETAILATTANASAEFVV
jgi:DNA-binding NarL/FixJ family response regulator